MKLVCQYYVLSHIFNTCSAETSFFNINQLGYSTRKVLVQCGQCLMWKKKMFEHLVFVYGTLKRGEPNYSLIQPGKQVSGKSVLIGTGHTQNKFPLVIATRYNIPHLLDAVGKGNLVTGEIYSVDESMLNNLDILEGIPKHYQRRRENIVLQECLLPHERTEDLKANTVLNCWIYVCGNFKEELLQLPHLTSFSNEITGYIPR